MNSVQKADQKKETKLKTDCFAGAPEYLGEFKMIVREVELKAFYDAPTKQITYTYTLHWEDPEKSPTVALAEPSPPDALSISKSRSSTSVNSETTLSKKQSSQIALYRSVHPVMTICDGPCKRAVSSDKLQTMGRCGHYLCAACYGIVTNADGTKGCSALTCNWNGRSRDEAVKRYQKICHLQRRRAKEMKERGMDVKPASSLSQLTKTRSSTSISSAKSNTTNTSNEQKTLRRSESDTESTRASTVFGKNSSVSTPTTEKSAYTLRINPTGKRLPIEHYTNKNEMTVVKLIVIDKNVFNATIRIHSQLECLTSCRVSQILSTMLLDKSRNPYGQFHNATCYYVILKNGAKKLKRIEKKDLAKHLYNFPQIGEYNFFVLDKINYVKNKKATDMTIDYDED